MPTVLDDLDLSKAERVLCQTALAHAGTIAEAARLLGITRHALKRRIIRHQLEWLPSDVSTARDHQPTVEAPSRVGDPLGLADDPHDTGE